MPIRPCTCKHEFQDERYGKGNRVHTERTKVSAGERVLTCTVCRSEKKESAKAEKA
jgi:hypothetical protein